MKEYNYHCKVRCDKCQSDCSVIKQTILMVEIRLEDLLGCVVLTDIKRFAKSRFEDTL